MQARNSARIRLPALPEDGRDQDACEGIQIVRPPQLTRGNMYRMVIPAPSARSRTIVSPSLNSACMASQQEADEELPRGMVRQSSPELIRTSIRPPRGCATQLGEQFMSEVIDRNHGDLQTDHAPNLRG
jgi:hypothetical protein